MKNKVGIVILNYNGSEYLNITLDALCRAKVDTAFEVGVIDNGSTLADAKRCRDLCRGYFEQNGLSGFFIPSNKNLGFSGGNNVVIRRFLEDASITHICLLNSDVIVTDGWLDILLSTGAEAVGPVTNATGNEQTVAADYTVELDKTAFETVNAFAKKRKVVYGDYTTQSEILNFFNTVFSRSVFEKIGFLDERFYPGSFEDNDFCLRMQRAGIEMVVARGCYVHHFGSGSFSKLDMPQRIDISNINRLRYEEKWGTSCKDGSWKLLESCRQDMMFFSENEEKEWALEVVSRELQEIEAMISRWAEAIAFYQSEQYAQQILAARAPVPQPSVPAQPVELLAEYVCGTELLKMAFRKAIIKLRRLLHLNRSSAPEAALQPEIASLVEQVCGTELLKIAARKAVIKSEKLLHLGKHCVTDTASGPPPQTPSELLAERVCGTELLKIAARKAVIKLKRLLRLERTPAPEAASVSEEPEVPPALDFDTLFRLARSRKAVCVFSPMFTKENEKDGYVQRVRAIDGTILKDYLKFYLMNEPACLAPSLQCFDDDHFYIVFNSHDGAQRELVFRLIRICSVTYTHSLLRFMTDSVSPEMCRIFTWPGVRHIWDVHGSVPEEYALNGDELGARLANEVEETLYARADVIVCVNKAMERHLREKHGDTCARFVTLPIFTPGMLEPVDCLNEKHLAHGDLPRVIYAGGLQKWQNVALMQDIMKKTMDSYEHHVFIPCPEEFNALWGARAPLKNALVSSRTPEEMAQEYRACHYGLVLRDDIVVNNVACPTKLVEYLQYGIVPVLKSEKIGDFAQAGMRYIKYTDFLTGKMPTAQEWNEMVRENYRVIQSFGDIQIAGAKTLASLVDAFVKRPVGLVVTTFDKGGLEQIVLNIYKGFKKAGHPTYLLCQKDILGPMAKEIDHGDLVVFNDSEQQFRAAVSLYNITTLHYHYNTFCMPQMRELGIRVLYTMHNVYVWKSDEEITEYAHILKHANTVIPVSNFVKEYFQSRTGAICNNLHTILNGSDFTELALRELPETLTRKALGLADTDVAFAFVASFYPAKGQIGMIGVMEQLIQHTPNIKLLLVGNIGSPDYYNRFEATLKNSPAKNNILWIPYVEHRYMGEFLRSTADAFILPTLQEGCSNAVLEAIYCDKPMIITRVGNANEVKDLPACRIVNPPYPDITQLSNEELVNASMQKDMSNQAEIADAMREMACNIETYKKKAVMATEKKVIFNSDSMVGAYLQQLV